MLRAAVVRLPYDSHRFGKCSSRSTTPTRRLAFYRDALGLEVRMDVESDGFRWVTVGAPDQDVDIVLFQPARRRSQAEGDALLALLTQGSLQAAIFGADDLDATFERVRASGAEVLQEPISQPWGRATARSATRPAISCASPRPERRRDEVDVVQGPGRTLR